MASLLGKRVCLDAALVVCLLWGPLARHCDAQDDPEDVLRTVQHGVTHREQLITSLSGWATVRTYRPTPDRYALEGLSADGDLMDSYELVRVRFAWSREHWRIESSKLISGGWLDWTVLETGDGGRERRRLPSQWLTVCDGDAILALNTSRLSTTICPRGHHQEGAFRPLIGPLRRILMLDPLVVPAEQLVRRGAPRLMGRESLQGVECYVFESRHLSPQARNTAVIRFWCAPSLGFAIVRAENVVSLRDDPARGYARLAVGSDWEEVGEGVWMPAFTRFENCVYVPDRDNSLDEVREARIEYVAANTDIKAECRLPELPIGTQVFDLRGPADPRGFVVGNTRRILADDPGPAGLEGTPDLLEGLPVINLPE